VLPYIVVVFWPSVCQIWWRFDKVLTKTSEDIFGTTVRLQVYRIVFAAIYAADLNDSAECSWLAVAYMPQLSS